MIAHLHLNFNHSAFNSSFGRRMPSPRGEGFKSSGLKDSPPPRLPIGGQALGMAK